MSEHQPFVLEVDYTETQAWDGTERPLVPPGDYNLEIISFERKDASTGTPMIEVIFAVADEGESKGMWVYNNYPLTENAKGRMKSLMVAAGASLNKIDSSEFIGATILGTVVHTEGKAVIGNDGQPKPARTFANVQNERPVQAAATTKAATPPVQKGAPVAQNKPANGAARRA